MISDVRLGRILVIVAVVAYAVAGAIDIVLALSSKANLTHSLGAACVMLAGVVLTLHFGRGKDFMGGPLRKGQSAVMGFASGIWISLALAAAGAVYPLVGVGRFISFMGYVGSIAFIPPIIASVVFVIIDRVRSENKK